MQTILLKLGGGAITDKAHNRRAARRDVIARVAGEIARAQKERPFRLVVVHGAGPFGHKLVTDYGLSAGVRAPDQVEGFVRTHNSMEDLGWVVMDTFRDHGLLGFPLPPAAWVIQRGRRIERLHSEVILGLLRLSDEIVPLLYGDMVLDLELGASVVSGDALVAALVGLLKPDRVLMGTDVAGVFTADPKADPGAQPIARLTAENLQQVLDSAQQAATVDVTGGMAGKVRELVATCAGTPGLIYDLTAPDTTYRALLGQAVDGTEVDL